MCNIKLSEVTEQKVRKANSQKQLGSKYKKCNYCHYEGRIHTALEIWVYKKERKQVMKKYSTKTG